MATARPKFLSGPPRTILRDVLTEMDDQHERDMQHHEDREDHHTDEVEAARHLTPAEQFDVPGRTGGDRGRHGDAGQQHGRPEHEDDEGIRQLLERIVGAEIGERRDMETEVDHAANGHAAGKMAQEVGMRRRHSPVAKSRTT